jgi:deazaflavin-dependent oxidoreductase (nitroreductase family)
MQSSSKRWMKRIGRAANSVHVALYRASGGKFANRIANLPLLLITTVGRKTGKTHINPVVYLRDGSDYLISASTGGMDWNPAWYFNLKQKPEIKIQIGDQALNVLAVIIEGEERNRLYGMFKAASPNFGKYERGTSRLIPVIRLIPAEIS